MHIIHHNDKFYVDDGAELIAFETLDDAMEYVNGVVMTIEANTGIISALGGF